MELHIASAAGNVFGYVWDDDFNYSNMGRYAQTICPRGTGLGLDGLFWLQRPQGGPWRMDHWEPDGAKTFCSNGSRAALALEGSPQGPDIEVLSSGVRIRLRRDGGGIGIHMPEGEGFGLRAVPMPVAHPAGFGWIGNPQLVLRVPAVDAVDLPALAPPLRAHGALPGGTNVNVVEVLEPGVARIRSWERGVEGETLCCGTGCAVAAAWLARETGRCAWTLHPTGGDPVQVTLRLGSHGQWRDLWLSGPVRRIATAIPEAGLLGD